ncbi:DUF4064 domain-containing protein [Alkalicoccobacillus gibsonii]|uniref:DUF4064 domain-containing protein n=1 Tax=Alkalicoccobacillus gibsonii TaxID=79881 RepID=UPI0019324578|nr:DUF4064 domain-containing protein [Alkalicoccobacillus gibsonii]MBM0065765.1 DUF4064 domain-containing protein [Alkalicoccobacillus gibsonii]
MKRTGELVLGIISSVLLLLGILSAVSINTFFTSADSAQFQEEFNQEMANDPTLTEADVEMVMGLVDSVPSFMTGLIVSWIIAGILGIIATIFVKKKTKLAGILFLVGGVIGIVSVIPAILYVIAGIMALVRKAPQATEPYETV